MTSLSADRPSTNSNEDLFGYAMPIGSLISVTHPIAFYLSKHHFFLFYIFVYIKKIKN